MNRDITEYFSWKKRQLNSQSENGDNPKKQREDSTVSENDTLTEGLKSLDRLAILVNCLLNLETQMNVFLEYKQAN